MKHIVRDVYKPPELGGAELDLDDHIPRHSMGLPYICVTGVWSGVNGCQGHWGTPGMPDMYDIRISIIIHPPI